MSRRWQDRWRGGLASKHALWLVPAIAAGLLAFGLDTGWLVDDYVHRAALTGDPNLPDLHRTPEQLFAFVDGDPDRLADVVARGIWPWWSASDLRLAFWRPVTGWSHAFDYVAWPENPWFMHLHSLAWHLLAVVLLLTLYRRILPSAAVAGLAGLIFAIDDSHAFPALWLANRNAAIAVALGVACLLAHDRWRRDEWRPGAVVGPLLLLGAVLANEGAVAIGGYLLAYAIFVDSAPCRQRLTALLPSTGVGIAWAVAYKIGGYGTQGSGVYVDPIGEPLHFAAHAVERAPFLLWGWWGFPPADLANLLPDSTRWRAWLITLLLLTLLAVCLRPVLQREAIARCLGLGMLLALLPACSTFPSNRLLGFVGIGAAGLLALLVADLAKSTSWSRRTIVALLLAIHVLAPPMLSRLYLQQMIQLDRMIGRSATSLADLTSSALPESQRVIVVATPSAFVSLASMVVAASVHDWQPPTTLVLSSSLESTEITRVDASTLLLRPEGGFLRSPGSPDPSPRPDAGLDSSRALLMLDYLFRDLRRDPFAVGDRVTLDGVTLEILETEAGRPLAIACQFAESLDRDDWRWLAWRKGRHESFPLPEIGETVTWNPGL